jgi:hypothetical protein
LRASASFVPALARCGRCTLTPAAAPALTGTYPGSPASKPALLHAWAEEAAKCPPVKAMMRWRQHADQMMS